MKTKLFNMFRIIFELIVFPFALALLLLGVGMKRTTEILEEMNRGKIML